MKRIAQLVLLTVLLAACAAPTADIPSTSPGPSATQTLTPKNTSTALSASLTPDTSTPDTPTVTPLPTIPTFTPTFDVRTIVTATPAPRAECPEKDDTLRINLNFDDLALDVNKEIQNFLNHGGSIDIVVDAMSSVYSQRRFQFVDVTNDSIPDLIFDGFTQAYDTFYVLWCQDGHYELFSGEQAMGLSINYIIYETVDINNNGVPEIVVYKNNCTGGGCYSFFIVEWNGETFINLAPDAQLDGVYENEIAIYADEKIGPLGLILKGGYWDRTPTWRPEIHSFFWDGKVFAAQPIEYSDPEYRFQAIQDADLSVRLGKLDNALSLYEVAITDTNLKEWSPKLQVWEQIVLDAIMVGMPTPTQSLEQKSLADPTEYPRLAAYAYYRMLILHTFLGEMDAAQVKYATLQEKFPADSPGHPYVEMATDFWNAYQSSGLMYDACAAAIAYADAHPEILTPLGSDYHGWQSHQYQPADVCPFR